MKIFCNKALLTLTMLVLAATTASGQSYRRLGTEFEAMRTVELAPQAAGRTKIVVVEFLHQGLVQLAKPNDRTTANLAVVAKSGDVVPVRLLQLGPGDFCRIAFEPLARQTHYELYYGGKVPPSPALLPNWSADDVGLRFESREYKAHHLQSLASLRAAFDSAVPIGADYVPSVHHAHNPTDITVRPFLSRYSGKLRIKEPGEYLFWTSSQDASFLVIDGREVVAAPGRHGPAYQAQPHQAGTIQLAAGTHDFEYHHAAIGYQAMMVVAWARKPHGAQAPPALLPPEWFENESIVRVEPDPVMTRLHRLVPDFDSQTLGDVPLPDNPLAMIGVRFRNRSLPAVTLGGGAKLRWDFGDGQTSTEPDPYHVFLKPGLYTVSLGVQREGRLVTTTNRIQIDRPYRDYATKEKAHELDDYLPILTQYDAATLDPASARQLVLAYQWKGEDRGQRTEDRKGEKGSKKAFSRRTSSGELKSERETWLRRAVDVGRIYLTAVDKPDGEADHELVTLALLTGSIARFDLGDPKEAVAIYRLASRPQKIHSTRLRVDCATRAADIAINELGDRKMALAMLTSAASDLGMKELVGQLKPKPFPARSGSVEARFFRVLGDYAASGGQGERAVEAYRAATAAVPNQQLTATKDIARRGAFGRSTEQFLKDGKLDRTAREIDAWQESYPDEKIDGYFTLLYARLLFVRGRFEAAVGQCEQLSAVNRESPYLDRLLMLAADSQEHLGQKDRAAALLRELIESHPGSPLVPEAKRRVAEL